MRLLIYSLSLLAIGFTGGLVAIQQYILPNITFYASVKDFDKGYVTAEYKDLSGQVNRQKFDAIITLDLPDESNYYGKRVEKNL